MKWFSGSVEEAIRDKTANKALLLVHISDGEQDSLAMDAIWETVEITDVPFVCLRLTAGSQSFQQFTQYYPVVAVPTGYFIGLDGKVIEAVVGKKKPEEVPQFVNRAVATFKTLLASVPQQAVAPATVPQPAVAPVTVPTPTVAPVAVQEQPRTVTPQPPAPVPQEPVSAPAPAPSNPSPTIEERLQKAREVVQKREADREREDEFRRRRDGQELAKIREDMETKQREAAADERRKQRESDKVYMEKLRKQIEEDRVEKAQRFNAERQRDREQQEEKMRQKAQEAAEATAREQAARALVARIQFRLPDGSSVVQQFDPKDKLESAYNFAKTLLPSARRGIALSTVSPRRMFTEEEMDQTLADLTLAPSAVLLVLRLDANSSTGQGETNFFSMLVTSFFGFVATVWAYISGFIFAQPAVAPPSTPQQQEQQPKKQKTPQSESTSQRPSTGKVYRLHDLKRDDDADKATWNGNSTNQM